jgi:hypothetical protein
MLAFLLLNYYKLNNKLRRKENKRLRLRDISRDRLALWRVLTSLNQEKRMPSGQLLQESILLNQLKQNIMKFRPEDKNKVTLETLLIALITFKSHKSNNFSRSRIMKINRFMIILVFCMIQAFGRMNLIIINKLFKLKVGCLITFQASFSKVCKLITFQREEF